MAFSWISARGSGGTGLKVDFLMCHKGRRTLIEVKSATGNIKSTKAGPRHLSQAANASPWPQASGEPHVADNYSALAAAFASLLSLLHERLGNHSTSANMCQECRRKIVA